MQQLIESLQAQKDEKEHELQVRAYPTPHGSSVSWSSLQPFTSSLIMST
jgi:hypothetical protein